MSDRQLTADIRDIIEAAWAVVEYESDGGPLRPCTERLRRQLEAIECKPAAQYEVDDVRVTGWDEGGPMGYTVRATWDDEGNLVSAERVDEGDRMMRCGKCGDVPCRRRPSPEAGPAWRCSECGEEVSDE